MVNKKTGLLPYGVVRGLMGQVIGTVIGLATISLLRMILGLGWDPEPSWVFAMVVGFFGFIIGPVAIGLGIGARNEIGRSDWRIWSFPESSVRTPPSRSIASEQTGC